MLLPNFPPAGISAAMQDGKHNDCAILNLVIDTEWKPAHQRASCLSVATLTRSNPAYPRTALSELGSAIHAHIYTSSY